MAEHDRHDRLVAAAAADRGGSLPGPLAACTSCVALAADLRDLALALPGSAIPSRPRDLRLSAEDAARLRRPVLWRLAGLVREARVGIARPLAMGLTTLGIAGLLMSTVPTVIPLGGAAAVGGPSVESVDPLRTSDQPIDVSGGQHVVVPPGPSLAEPPAVPPAVAPVPATDDRIAMRILSAVFLAIAAALVVGRRMTAPWRDRR